MKYQQFTLFDNATDDPTGDVNEFLKGIGDDLIEVTPMYNTVMSNVVYTVKHWVTDNN